MMLETAAAGGEEMTDGTGLPRMPYCAAVRRAWDLALLGTRRQAAARTKTVLYDLLNVPAMPRTAVDHAVTFRFAGAAPCRAAGRE